MIVDNVELKCGAKLHRTHIAGHDEVSAIYVGNIEVMSCFADREQEMVDTWNNGGYKAFLRKPEER